MPVDANLASLWASQRQPPWGTRCRAFLGFVRHQWIPRLLDHQFTIANFFPFVLRVLAIVALGSSPLVMAYLKGDKIDLHTSVILIVILACLLLYNWGYDKFAVRRKQNGERRDHERRLALRQNEATRQLLPYITVQDGTHDAEIDKVIMSLLNCMDHKTRSVLNQRQDGYFQVSLLLFCKRDEQLLVRARAHNTRPVGAFINVRDAAAYYVAKAKRDWKAIGDLAHDAVFPYTGLSETGNPPYRSVLLIPMIADGICKGVISIDAAKPYEFWGAIGSDLTTQLMPYILLVRSLISSNDYGIAV